MPIHTIVKKIREKKNISQECVSYYLNLTQSQYSRRESGNIKFTLEEIIVLSKFFKVNLFKRIEIEIPEDQFEDDDNRLQNQYHIIIEEKDKTIQLLENIINKITSNASS
jgi:transcriptional regulator with XRE-family HTH domain